MDVKDGNEAFSIYVSIFFRSFLNVLSICEHIVISKNSESTEGELLTRHMFSQLNKLSPHCFGPNERQPMLNAIFIRSLVWIAVILIGKRRMTLCSRSLLKVKVYVGNSCAKVIRECFKNWYQAPVYRFSLYGYLNFSLTIITSVTFSFILKIIRSGFLRELMIALSSSCHR